MLFVSVSLCVGLQETWASRRDLSLSQPSTQHLSNHHFHPHPLARSWCVPHGEKIKVPHFLPFLTRLFCPLKLFLKPFLWPRVAGCLQVFPADWLMLCELPSDIRFEIGEIYKLDLLEFHSLR